MLIVCISANVFFSLPSAKRVSPDDHQAVPAACFDPLVHMHSVCSQAGFSRLSGGISKTCQGFLHQLLLTHTTTETLRFPATRWQYCNSEGDLLPPLT